MRAHKHDSKGGSGGSYVGGFLHLFDWNAKSRKKLFSSKSESPEQPKQTKRLDGNMPITRFNTMEEDEIIGGLDFKENSNCSCATSITDEDGYGTKAPGVVARLMGLNSLPTYNFSDAYPNPSFDSQSVKDSFTNYIRKEPEFEPIDCQMEPVDRPVKVKPQKMVVRRAIEKFQTETLPPKLAKSIPITRNKLLSPTKNSGFVSSSNPVHIMETASKIPFVRSPQLMTSSSVPFRVKVSREKTENSTRKPKILEASRRPLESNNDKNVKSQQLSEPKKSISLALQAKANVQKREGVNHRPQSVKTQSNTDRNGNKNPVCSNVLKQNNQKQNSLVDRGKSTPKSSCSNNGQQPRKPVSQKTSHKKEPYSTTQRKRALEVTDHNNNININNNNNNHSIKNIVRDKSYKNNRNDVISFTFTAPIARPMNTNNNTLDYTINASNSNSNVIGSDALSTLLEQKLRELTCNPAFASQDSSTESETRDEFTAMESDKTEDSSSYDPLHLANKHHNQDCNSSYGFSSNERMFHVYEYRKFLNGRLPSPNSVLEPSFTTESCNSSHTLNSSNRNLTSFQAQKLTTPINIDTELLDSASSLTMVTKLEADYVKEILSDIETMFVDFTIGKTRKIVNPRVFDRLEFGKQNHELVKLRRELVFNCVSECMESRCRVWANGLAIVKRPAQLAQEVYNEITEWEEMKDSMVDELVDHDMSGNNYKKWLDFDVEALDIGVEIESRILDSLINEVVD